MFKVFIDGSAGTTGLRIYERLSERNDITLLSIPDEFRKDPNVKKEIMQNADVVFLCLPDDAARESASLVADNGPVIIDTSTAHRTDPNWTYGMPEINGQYEKIKSSKRIANPGCHASGFITLVSPLVNAGIINKSAKLTCFSLTGYSGGGKKMIAEYECDKPSMYDGPRQYGLSQNHKHLKEMAHICSLDTLPLFSPIVCDFYSGMEVTVPLFGEQINCTIDELKSFYNDYYNNGVIKFSDKDENGFLSSSLLSGYDGMEIGVFGNENRIILVSRFDNLGKGASGSAIQNMNIVMGLDEKTGLNLN